MSLDSISMVGGSGSGGGPTAARKRFLSVKSIITHGNIFWTRKPEGDDVIRSHASLSTSPSMPELHHPAASPSSNGGSSPPYSPASSTPCIRHSVDSEMMKGEDLYIAAPEYKLNEHHSFSLFAVFDGHNGIGAAFHARNNLMEYVKERVKGIEDREELMKALPEALAHAFVRTNASLTDGERSGTTATVVLINDWTVTVAGVGDSRAILDTAPGGVVALTKDHRFETSEEECRRVQMEGGTLGRLRTSDGIQVGPKRFWPGGLCVSRSVGDLDVGPSIIPLPHVVQVEVPPCGGRLVMGSDGLWDAMSSEKVARRVRHKDNADCARKLVKSVLKSKGLHDDITVLVVDIVPSHSPDVLASPHLKKSASGSGLFARLRRSLSSSRSLDGDAHGALNSPCSPGVGSPNFIEDHDSSLHGGSAYRSYLRHISRRAGKEEEEGEGEGERAEGKKEEETAPRSGRRREEEEDRVKAMAVKDDRENGDVGTLPDGCCAGAPSRAVKEESGVAAEMAAEMQLRPDAGGADDDVSSPEPSGVFQQDEEADLSARGDGEAQSSRRREVIAESERRRLWGGEREGEEEDEEEEDVDVSVGGKPCSDAKLSPDDGAWCWQCGAPVSPHPGTTDDVSIRAGHGYCTSHRPSSPSSPSCPQSVATSDPSLELPPAVSSSCLDRRAHGDTLAFLLTKNSHVSFSYERADDSISEKQRV
ncbi:hypothetical protein CBR_g24237 [Chara braunii]|uniref:PPM-type phosphatase domain-containing protein n=1 Tax=Chara braunii TaxID=69332 RepID=A0A388JMB4_CHABU|nr:hypothetical protein CBR_g24237 [Chara braunii]|eukprot:GBG58885.1 hypothetical protein CBR_g24237 [Chara braunii]